MPVEEYARDFEEQSIAEFYSLLEKASYSFVVNGGSDNHVSSGSHQDRDSLYEDLGLYIARNSHILIVVWDGEDSGKRGGTSQTVSFMLDMSASNGRLLDHIDKGNIYYIYAPRVGKKPGKIIGLEKINTRGKQYIGNEFYDKILSYIDDFNHTVRKLFE